MIIVPCTTTSINHSYYADELFVSWDLRNKEIAFKWNSII